LLRTPETGKQHSLGFEAAASVADVCSNRQKLGRHREAALVDPACANPASWENRAAPIANFTKIGNSGAEHELRRLGEEWDMNRGLQLNARQVIPLRVFSDPVKFQALIAAWSLGFP
jgi:hypothetical protein